MAETLLAWRISSIYNTGKEAQCRTESTLQTREFCSFCTEEKQKLYFMNASTRHLGMPNIKCF